MWSVLGLKAPWNPKMQRKGSSAWAEPPRSASSSEDRSPGLSPPHFPRQDQLAPTDVHLFQEHLASARNCILGFQKNYSTDEIYEMIKSPSKSKIQVAKLEQAVLLQTRKAKPFSGQVSKNSTFPGNALHSARVHLQVTATVTCKQL